MTPWQEVRALAEKWREKASSRGVAFAARCTLDRCADELDALIRDPAFIGMMEDAARYRFLRDNAGMGFQMVMQERREPDEWDAEIDEAMRGRENAD
jgi:hypothetical protein